MKTDIKRRYHTFTFTIDDEFFLALSNWVIWFEMWLSSSFLRILITSGLKFVCISLPSSESTDLVVDLIVVSLVVMWSFEDGFLECDRSFTFEKKTQQN